ncbi:mercury(II) reductase [Chengkuizengella sp. SCS-71B]|uniref:mercury(II) reductase n=1 Tax=Chengkuizengella sp. SCS-71B TaxID=3115290 RepID=UPI0032C214B9
MKNNKFDFDFAIIGSGAAAFSAAIQASQYNTKIVMIEKGTIGGTCVNIGCIPSKTLIQAGNINHTIQHHLVQGLQSETKQINFKNIISQKDELVFSLRQQKYENLIDQYGFEFIRGEAKFTNAHTIEVNGKRITSNIILIATGASPFIPDIPGLKDVKYLTSTSAMNLEKIPNRMIVIGAGYIGLELGQMFHNLGSKVTLLKRNDRLLPSYDLEISERVSSFFNTEHLKLLTGVTYKKIEQKGTIKRIHITIQGEDQIIEADEILVAAGRSPKTSKLNLKNTKVHLGESGEILVNEYMQTNVENIYAAGDVLLSAQFVYTAAHQGSIVADHAFGTTKRKNNSNVIPSVIFTNPSIASVGITEQTAKENDIPIKTSILSMENVPRAIINLNTEGLIKIVAEKNTNKILGVQVVAENAGEIIYAATLAVQFGLTIDNINETFAPYLTMAEGLKLTSLAFDKDPRNLSCCAGN